MSDKVNVKLKRLHPDAVVPQYARELDAGFDLVAVEDVIVRPGESVSIPTGWAIALPEGWELQVRPRSGIGAKTKLRISNSPGTIDAGYRGEVGVLIDNIHPLAGICTNGLITIGSRDLIETEKEYPIGSYIILKGDRIAQAVLSQAPQATFEVVDELDETERGTGGYGSSGTR